MDGACKVVLLFLGLATTHGAYHYRTEYLDVPVDHFSFTNNATFRMRYLINDTYWHSKGGPILFYTGNEGDIQMFADNTGFIWESAPEFHALIVFAEHRYYGESLPFGNKSYSELKNLGYLTSEQALADYVDLIHHLRAKQKEPRSPVIAVGGSYGGMLAAWFRIKYPYEVEGAIAASAPILQFTGLTPCGAFQRIITSDFNAASEECTKSIRKSWGIINNLTSSDGGRKWLSDAWKLCKPLQNTDDVKLLKDWLSDVYTNMAMLNYPYPTNFLTPLPGNPINVACKLLPNSSLEDKKLLHSLFNAISVYFNYTGKAKCLDVAEEASSNLGDEGWDFQACTEMVMPICSDGYNDMFEKSPWNFEQYSTDCYNRWKVHPQADLAVKMYGGRDISTASNIVFSNGLLDPWASGGVLHNMSRSVVAILIPEGAHHLDLRESNSADPESVIAARSFHRQSIWKWIKHYNIRRFKQINMETDEERL